MHVSVSTGAFSQECDSRVTTLFFLFSTCHTRESLLRTVRFARAIFSRPISCALRSSSSPLPLIRLCNILLILGLCSEMLASKMEPRHISPWKFRVFDVRSPKFRTNPSRGIIQADEMGEKKWTKKSTWKNYFYLFFGGNENSVEEKCDLKFHGIEKSLRNDLLILLNFNPRVCAEKSFPYSFSSYN